MFLPFKLPRPDPPTKGRTMPEFHIPETLLNVLQSLAARPWWAVRDLPPELTPDAAIRLDGLGFISANQNPSSPFPPKWYSPLERGRDDLFSRWDAILNRDDHRTRTIGVRVSAKGHAALASWQSTEAPQRAGKPGRKPRSPDKLDRVLRRAMRCGDETLADHRWKDFIAAHREDLPKSVTTDQIRKRYLRRKDSPEADK